MRIQCVQADQAMDYWQCAHLHNQAQRKVIVS